MPFKRDDTWIEIANLIQSCRIQYKEIQIPAAC